MGYKSFVVMTNGEEASNSLVFRTAPEADAYGDELLSRWFAPVSHVSRECDAPVSHEWNFETGRSEALPQVKTYQLDQSDLRL